MAQWQGNHVSSKQLFYALKQEYPDLPDRLVSHCIEKAGGDRRACLELLDSPEYTPYRLKRPNSLQLDDKIQDEGSKKSISTPTTPCRITGRAPITTRTMILPSISYINPNNGLSVLIQAQLLRKNNLEKEMEKDRKRLEDMKKRRDELKILLLKNPAPYKVQKLKEEISTLNKDCIKLYSDLDSADGSAFVRTELNANGDGATVGTDAWRCEMCTFRNHPLMNTCETCLMPRITLGIKAA